jgi:hypothetical protein
VEILFRTASESDVRFIFELQRLWSEEGNVYGFVPESPAQVEAALGPYLLVAEGVEGLVGFISGSVHAS